MHGARAANVKHWSVYETTEMPSGVLYDVACKVVK